MTSSNPSASHPWWDASPNHPEFERDSSEVSVADEGMWAVLESKIAVGLIEPKPIPEPARQCLSALRRPETAAVDIAAILARNGGFGERFLALAQAADWWPSSGNGAAALAAIGTRRLRLLAWAAGLAVSFDAVDRVEARAHVTRSVACATACAHVAARLELDADAAWLAGFFHNAGRILVNGAAAELEAQGWPIAQRIHFGSWKKRLCAIAGAELALSWDLPDDVVDGASQHFDRLGPLTPDMALVALGTRITTRLRSREEDDGGMVVTEAIVNGLRRDRLALLATLEGVDAAVDRACDLVN